MKPYCSNHGTIIVLCSNSVKKTIYVSPGIDDKMFAVISIYIFFCHLYFIWLKIINQNSFYTLYLNIYFKEPV